MQFVAACLELNCRVKPLIPPPWNFVPFWWWLGFVLFAKVRESGTRILSSGRHGELWYRGSGQVATASRCPLGKRVETKDLAQQACAWPQEMWLIKIGIQEPYSFGFRALWRTDPVMQYVVTTVMLHGCQAAELVHISPPEQVPWYLSVKAALPSQFKNDAVFYRDSRCVWWTSKPFPHPRPILNLICKELLCLRRMST
jgi:hypothetical protein